MVAIRAARYHRQSKSLKKMRCALLHETFRNSSQIFRCRKVLHKSVDKFVENDSRMQLTARPSMWFAALHNFRATVHGETNAFSRQKKISIDSKEPKTPYAH
jgi:hypothetical protein